MMRCGYVWFDIGIYQSMIEVSNFIVIIEEWQGLKVFCFEEIVFCWGFINVEQFQLFVELLKKMGYG